MMKNHEPQIARTTGIAALGIAVFTSVALVAPENAVPSATAATTSDTATTASAAAATASTVVAKVPSWPGVKHLMPPFLQSEAVQSTDLLDSLINKRLSRRITKAPLGKNVSMRVEDLETGRTIYSKRGRRGMIPASNMKLATALAALSAYGKDHVLPTTVNRVPSSRVIVIRGGGDPLLSSTNIDALAQATAQQVRDAGLPSRKLLVRYDASLFAPATLPAAWPPSYFYDYAAKPTALMRDRRRVVDPAKDAAVYFRQRLRVHGLKGRVRTNVRPRAVPDGAVELASDRSHTVGDALWRMLLYSDNTVAEVMVRHVALSQGRATSPAGSAEALRAELAGLGVPLKRARFHDGSGLSRDNRLPGKTLTGVIRASVNPHRPDLSSPYRWFSVPVAGKSGTLSNRFHGKSTRCAVGRVMAKTGTLYDVVSLSGVAIGTDGRHRAFSIIVNQRPREYSLRKARHRVDRLGATLTGCI